MKHIVLFGAGKSATCLIDLLINEANLNGWQLTVCDVDLQLAESKIGKGLNAKAVLINVEDELQRRQLINSSDIVISLLPPQLHFLIAKDCVENNKNLLTASYSDEKIKSLEKDIVEKGLLFLCEMGLDPGIDHMSAMRIIDSIKNKGGKISSFKSHCGGLVAPESDNNPWHYKITWNPRNVVLAGKDGADFLKEKKTVHAPYRSIFGKDNKIEIPGLYPLTWYPNRDSLNYIPLYGLENVSTFIRTTLRHAAYCRGWNKLVNMGFTATDDYESIKNCKTFCDWYNLKISPFVTNNKDWNFYLHLYVTDPYKDEFNRQIKYLGLRSNQILPSLFKCSADILQHLMETKLAMEPNDKDMVIMLHEVEYELEEKKYKVTSTLIAKGQDILRTAMAKTVGLPLGIATKLILEEKIKLTGLHIPTSAKIYEPVLSELEKHGIKFNETLEEV